MEIGEYEDWMQLQVAEMFRRQWGISKNEFARHIEQFYAHPYQKDRCLRFVAREGKKIIGFQGFVYWPYDLHGKIYNSFQAADSIVHEDYRGRGAFRELLN